MKPVHSSTDKNVEFTNLTKREKRIVTALIEAFARYHGTWIHDRYNTYKCDPEEAEIGRKNISREVRLFFEEEFNSSL